jgi:hypothetical protein
VLTLGFNDPMRPRLHRLTGALLVWSCPPLAWALDAGSLVPVRWPGGPLEVARRAGERAIPSLDLLRDTPINCLIVPWSGPGDAAIVREQQQLVSSYAKDARTRGFAVLGLLYAGSDPVEAVAAAVDAHLDGLALEPDFADFARLSQAAQCAPELALISLHGGGGAPGIRIVSDSGAAVATPTSEPWIDSNLWLVRALRAKGQAPVWLTFALENPSIDNYVRAIADSAAAGGQWVVAPDDSLLSGLANKRPEAVAKWRNITEALGFFAQHRAWCQLSAIGPVGVVRDPVTRYPEIADENLNLIARRRIPYRTIERASLCAPALEGLKALLSTEISIPNESERSLLKTFVERGGLLVTGPWWGATVPKDQDYIAQPLGKGQVIVYRDESPDPESLSKNLLRLLGKGNLGIRLFNAPTILPYLSAREDGKQRLVQMINYASGPSERITVRVRGPYRTARLFSLNGSAVDLPIERSEEDVELTIERIQTYAALVLEK